MPFVHGKQRTARDLAESSVPETEIRILIRDLATRLIAIPFLDDSSINRDLRDDIQSLEIESVLLDSCG